MAAGWEGRHAMQPSLAVDGYFPHQVAHWEDAPPLLTETVNMPVMYGTVDGVLVPQKSLPAHQAYSKNHEQEYWSNAPVMFGTHDGVYVPQEPLPAHQAYPMNAAQEYWNNPMMPFSEPDKPLMTPFSPNAPEVLLTPPKTIGTFKAPQNPSFPPTWDDLPTSGGYQPWEGLAPGASDRSLMAPEGVYGDVLTADAAGQIPMLNGSPITPEAVYGLNRNSGYGFIASHAGPPAVMPLQTQADGPLTSPTRKTPSREPSPARSLPPQSSPQAKSSLLLAGIEAPGFGTDVAMPMTWQTSPRQPQSSLPVLEMQPPQYKDTMAVMPQKNLSPGMELPSTSLPHNSNAERIVEAALAKMSPEARHKYHQLKSGITYDDVHHDEDVEASMRRQSAFDRLSPAAKEKYLEKHGLPPGWSPSPRTGSPQRERPHVLSTYAELVKLDIANHGSPPGSSHFPPTGSPQRLHVPSERWEHFGLQDTGAIPDSVAYRDDAIGRDLRGISSGQTSHAGMPLTNRWDLDWSDMLDFAKVAAKNGTQRSNPSAAEKVAFQRRQEARKQLEKSINEQVQEALSQLHDIEKKDLLERKEWSSKEGPHVQNTDSASARAQRLLDEEDKVDYERMLAENERLRRESFQLEQLRLENEELKHGVMSLEVKKMVHAERVEKERLLAENEMLRGLMPKILSPGQVREAARIHQETETLPFSISSDIQGDLTASPVVAASSPRIGGGRRLSPNKASNMPLDRPFNSGLRISAPPQWLDVNSPATQIPRPEQSESRTTYRVMGTGSSPRSTQSSPTLAARPTSPIPATMLAVPHERATYLGDGAITGPTHLHLGPDRTPKTQEELLALYEQQKGFSPRGSAA